MPCVYHIIIDGCVAETYADYVAAKEMLKALKAHGFDAQILTECKEGEEV